MKSWFPARRPWRTRRFSPKWIQGDAEGSAEVEVTAARLEAVAEPEVDAKTFALSWFGTACFGAGCLTAQVGVLRSACILPVMSFLALWLPPLRLTFVVFRSLRT